MCDFKKNRTLYGEFIEALNSKEAVKYYCELLDNNLTNADKLLKIVTDYGDSYGDSGVIGGCDIMIFEWALKHAIS